MKSILTAAACLVLAMFSFVSLAVAAPPETLQLSDLVRRPDRWPAEVTIKSELDFGGAKLSPGQKVSILEYNGGADLGVNAGPNQLFSINVSECDFLDAANAAWAKLSPPQRALEPQTVIADASLWPAKVHCSSGFTLNSGKEIPAGQEYEVMSIERNGEVMLWEPEGKAKLTAQISQTDAVARARELVTMDPAKRPARIASALKSVMVDSSGKPISKDDIDGQTVFALYYGASWCGPCRQFSPGFVKYINSIAAANPKLTVVLLSNDKNDADLFKYMQSEKMPFAAVPMKALEGSGVLYGYMRGSIPQLTIVDRYGKILGDSWNGNRYVGPKVALAALEKSVKAGATK